MSSRHKDLFDLLPEIYRTRDQEHGVLKKLCDVAQSELDRVRQQIDTAYDSWFIETCPLERVPELGELVGIDLPSALFPHH
ncbi:MAG: hypothetical protein HN348_06520, partial [Proteobacteria bacterium]|nr:hypothetical protein [Pseudomonadota bacterium]